jgi:Ca-activated chloride channel homolog
MDKRRRALWIALLAAIVLPAAAGADGLIVISDPPQPLPGHFSFTPLEVSSHHVAVTVNDLVAVTTVDEEFFNPTDQRLEGTYIFPLPENAHIDRFSMDIAGKMADAELLPADKARAFYEDIVRKMKDPALLEYAGRGAFRLRIYPIEPRSGKRIRITYTQLLKSDAGLVEYVYPMGTEKFSSAALKDVAIAVTLDGRAPLKSVYSPSHPVEIRRDGDRRAVVGWEARDAWPDADFRLVFSRTPNPVGIDFLASRSSGDDGYFMLMASPGISADRNDVQPKDICFVLDTSGSMAGVSPRTAKTGGARDGDSPSKLEQARKALLFCLANLGSGDRFQVIRFSTEAEPLFEGLVRADKDHLDQAYRFVDGLRPMGGTAIGDALLRALALRGAGDAGGAGAAGAAGRPYMVIFLTDGLPTVGETREDALVDSIAGSASTTRVFCFGIGNDVNTHLLDRIASQTRAVSQYVLPEEDIEVKVSGFYSRIKDPVLSDLTLEFSNPSIRVKQLLPGVLPDLFNGDMLVVFGRYSGSGPSMVRITGTFNGKPRSFAADVSFPERSDDNPFIGRLWAARRVGWLLDEMRMHGETSELRDEVVRLARSFGIVTPYTAYLVMEDEASRNIPVRLRSFQELEEDRGAADAAREKIDSIRKESKSESSRAGASAVGNSMAVQDLMGSLNLQQAAPSAGLAKTAAPATGGRSGGYRAWQAQNYAQQVRMVNGRAFYQNGSVWTDSTAQGRPGLNRKDIRFGSEEYFGLLRKSPVAASWLALGNNLDVVVDGTLYSIRE